MSKIAAALVNKQQNRMRAGWRLLGQFLFFLIFLVAVMIPTVVVQYFARVPLLGDATLIVIQSFVTLLTVAVACLLLDRRKITSLGFARVVWFDRTWLVELSIGFALGAIAMLWIFAAEFLLGWIAIDRVGMARNVSMLSLVQHGAGLLLLMVLVGVSEEMFSRGYQLKNLSEGFRCLGSIPAVTLALVISSAVFGVLHVGNPNATGTSTLGVALAGIMLGTARVATGSLAAPIGLHISWNYFQGPVLGFPVSGQAFTHSFFHVTQRGDPLWTGGAFGPEAGLIGCIATLALTLAFVVWGATKSQATRYCAALTHYRRPKRLQHRRVGSASSLSS